AAPAPPPALGCASRVVPVLPPRALAPQPAAPQDRGPWRLRSLATSAPRGAWMRRRLRGLRASTHRPLLTSQTCDFGRGVDDRLWERGWRGKVGGGVSSAWVWLGALARAWSRLQYYELMQGRLRDAVLRAARSTRLLIAVTSLAAASQRFPAGTSRSTCRQR